MGDPWAAMHEAVTWLGAGGGGAALWQMARNWMATQRRRKVPSLPPPPMATQQDMSELADRVALLEGADPQAFEDLRREVDLLRRGLAAERTKRYDLQKDVQGFLRQQEDAWRRMERTLGQLEGQYLAMRDK